MNEIRCIYCDETVCTEPDPPSPEDTLTTRVKSVEHDAACERNPLAARAQELEAIERHLRGLLAGVQSELRDLDSTNAALTKRVAELEEQLHRVKSALDGANNATQLSIEETRRLQSQLAWTPVAQGLPTEPGRYQFIDDINFANPDWGEFPHYWRKPSESPSEEYHWFLHGRRWFNSPLDWCRGYTYWRKVELPVRPITLPEAT